jgi:hypothetical protein
VSKVHNEVSTAPGLVTTSTPSLVNHLSTVAQEEILRFAGRFEDREDYGPLEDLAERVQRLIVVEGCRHFARGARR